MAESAKKQIDLSFISEDVRNQLAHSRGILDQAKVLRNILPNVQDPAMRAQIERSISELLTIASELTANATSTSSNTVLTVVSSANKRP